MKWFLGNSSTNAEGKFEYHEPKLLRICRIPGFDDVITSNIMKTVGNTATKQTPGISFDYFK